MTDKETSLLNEHGDLLFDFSKMEDVIQYHYFITQSGQRNFCDVDFTAKSADTLYFIETKKSSHSEKTREEFCSWISRKYKDCLLLHWAYNNDDINLKPVYILLFESDRDDKKARKKLRNEIKDYLPIKLSKDGGNKIISSFSVMNLDEFTKKYPDISITSVE